MECRARELHLNIKKFNFFINEINLSILKNQLII